MSDDQINSEKVNPKREKIKDFVGQALIILGGLLSFWVFLRVLAIFNDPSEISRFQFLVGERLESSVLGEEGEGIRLVVPPQVLALSIPLILLIVVVCIAGTFIHAGARLLQGDIDRLLMRMAGFGYSLKRKITDLEYRLKEKMDNLGQQSSRKDKMDRFSFRR